MDLKEAAAALESKSGLHPSEVLPKEVAVTVVERVPPLIEERVNHLAEAIGLEAEHVKTLVLGLWDHSIGSDGFKQYVGEVLPPKVPAPPVDAPPALQEPSPADGGKGNG